MKSIVFIFDSIPYFKGLLKERGLTVYSTYRQLGFFRRLLFKIGQRFKFRYLLRFRFDDWATKIGDTDIFICFATKHIAHLEYLRKINSRARIILWYWNPVKACFDISKIPSNLCEQWSFDPQDCETFKLRFNTTFFFKEIKLEDAEIEYDLFFLGLDKGRREDLRLLERDFLEQGVRTNFYIVNPSDRNYPQVDYLTYLSYLAKANAIFDYVQGGQTGLTVRCMESLFLRKKLVTTNTDIVNQDFYNRQNIFVVGIDNIDRISEFVSKPYIDVPPEIVNRYDVESWLNRFL